VQLARTVPRTRSPAVVHARDPEDDRANAGTTRAREVVASIADTAVTIPAAASRHCSWKENPP
jgi:hypothetical protein